MPAEIALPAAAGDRAPTFDQIVERLTCDQALAVPPRVQAECKDPVETKRKYLSQLIHKDPSILLERHGHLLSQAELEAFEPLNKEYEIQHWLQKLQPKKPSSACVKNRY